MTAFRLAEKGLVAMTAGTVMHQHLEGRREARGFLHPVGDDGGGTDQQHGPLLAQRAFAFEHRQRLHGLAEAHVVGKASAESPFPEEGQPGVAADLVGPQRAVETRGCVE
jgi:hypothetical protein